MTITAPDHQPATPGELREDVAYLVYRAVDIATTGRAAALEVADQILARLAESGRPSTPGWALRWAADRIDADGLHELPAKAVHVATAGQLRRWADELDAAPAVYALPPEPSEGTQLRGLSGLHWQRYPAGWSNGVRHAIDWSYLLATDGPLSTAPPAGTEAA